jgi:ferredoxin
MPIVRANGQSIVCESGARLRDVLRSAGISLYSGPARIVNCRGIGSCGTCAVAIEQDQPDAIPPLNWIENARFNFPPHSAMGPIGLFGSQPSSQGLRLACQVRVLGDISVTKFDGFWGQGRQVAWAAEPIASGVADGELLGDLRENGQTS